MKTLKRRTLGLSVGFLSMLLLILVCATSAFADGGGTLTPGISAGSLSVSESGALPTLSDTLDGTNQTLNISLPLKVTDATGSGAGWHMTVAAQQFGEVVGGTTLRTLPFAFTLDSVGSTACDASSTCLAPTNSDSNTGVNFNSATAKITAGALDYNTDGDAPVAFYNAAINTGMGIYDLTPLFKVSVPGKTYAGTYSGSISITITSAP